VANNGDGTMTLTRNKINPINPVVQSAAISMQSAYLNLVNTNNILFNRADQVMYNTKQAWITDLLIK